MRRGEATGTATGVRTKSGRTAELARTARVVSTQRKAVLEMVRNLAIFYSFSIFAMGIFAYTERALHRKACIQTLWRTQA
jgi:H+-transporting ATPase